MNIQVNPAIPKIKREGINIAFLPTRSAMIPVKGVRKIPGMVNATTRRATCCFVIRKCSTIWGNAGAILATPITARRVVAKMR